MKAHRTDGISLSFALIFFAIFAWWTIAQVVDLELPAVGWFIAGGLILLGVLGLVGALRSARTATAEAASADVGTADAAAKDPYPPVGSGLPADGDPVSGPPHDGGRV
jgi:hypothetical protein